MSMTIDKKVVEMRFDNKQFEQNVQTSLSTIDKLKQSLNLKGKPPKVWKRSMPQLKTAT